MIVDPVLGFVVVWLFLGSAIAWLFKLIKFDSLKAIGIAYLMSLVPATMVALYLSQ